MIRNKFGISVIVYIINAIEFDVAFPEVPFCGGFKETMFIFGVYIRRDDVSNRAIILSDS
jgi:hypothetical protein